MCRNKTKTQKLQDYPINLRGFSNNKWGGHRSSKIRGFKGNTYGKASECHCYTKEEIKRFAEKHGYEIAQGAGDDI